MKVLVLNSGSSTLKYQLFETSLELMAANQDRMLTRGIVDRIGDAVADHTAAVGIALRRLTDGPVGNLEEIQAVGHRIVHGGDYFSQPVRIDDSVVERIRECAVLAPLHNPPNLSTYEACRERMPGAAHVAVFDTAFHQTLAPAAYTYGLPYEVCARYKVRRYGFHGTSHRYVALRFAQIRSRPLEEFKLVTCHLGNGCSMCAIDRGRSIDTSMGLTPLEGLLMGTRAGDTDLGAALYLMQWEKLDTGQMDALLNHSSGLAGISGVSNDMRTLLESAGQGNPRAQLAIDVFCYRIRKYIGAYFAALNGADAVVFTAGIGENAPAIRAQACESLDALGIRIDPARNASARGVEAEISAAGAATGVWVIPTNEELLIGRDTVRCLQAN
jgi:acetate kinase